MTNFNDTAKLIAPGLLFAMMAAMAAQFLSDHYGAPVMLMAILLGIPFHFLSEEERTSEGINFAAKHVLRLGVALLGLRVSADMLGIIGVPYILLVIAGTVLTILVSLIVVRAIGRDRAFGFLTGGAVAICGASAAMAISSILSRKESDTRQQESDLVFTVVCVTVLSTAAMILYPLIADAMGLSITETGVFLGATIHDVAQVVGAGYSVSEETGDTATLIKLFRVAMLAPIVFVAALVLRQSLPSDSLSSGSAKPPLIPGFVLVFLILATLNSFQVVPEVIKDGADVISRAALVTAVAAVGMKTSIAKLRQMGGSSITLVVGQTAFIAVIVLIGVSVL